MDFVTHRILTMKSVLKVGQYPTCTVAEVLAADCATKIRELYYTIQEIDFTDEVKEAAGIFVSIPKPGVSVDAWNENKRRVSAAKFDAMTDLERIKYWASKRRMQRAKRASYTKGNILAQSPSKGQLQAINHGHLNWKERGR